MANSPRPISIDGLSTVPSRSRGGWLPLWAWAGLLAVFAAIWALLVDQGIIGQTTARISREHGLVMPASAQNPVCRGDAWQMIMDRGASSTFEMNRRDLGPFVSQLKACTTGIIPANEVYQLTAPWLGVTPEASYNCASSTGDFLVVRIFPIDAEKVGVRLYTDWN